MKTKPTVTCENNGRQLTMFDDAPVLQPIAPSEAPPAAPAKKPPAKKRSSNQATAAPTPVATSPGPVVKVDVNVHVTADGASSVHVTSPRRGGRTSNARKKRNNADQRKRRARMRRMGYLRWEVFLPGDLVARLRAKLGVQKPPATDQWVAAALEGALLASGAAAASPSSN